MRCGLAPAGTADYRLRSAPSVLYRYRLSSRQFDVGFIETYGRRAACVIIACSVGDWAR